MVTEAILTRPFGDEPLVDVPLPRAPLARTLVQVRFPRLSTLVGNDSVANAFAAALGQNYPILHEQRETSITITPEGVTQSPGQGRIWQLRSADESWQISLGDSFLSLDTAAYVSRDDFAARLRASWAVFADIGSPPFVERIGVRYINRITEPDILSDLASLVRPEVLGGLGVQLEGVILVHSVSETLYQIDEHDGLQTRWGMLPPWAVLDPTVTPVAMPGWVFDLDSFRQTKMSADPDEIVGHLSLLASRAYRYFRWAVKAEFLARFGGEIV